MSVHFLNLHLCRNIAINLWRFKPSGTAMHQDRKSAEDCLAEAVECDRLVGLTWSETTRKMMRLAAAAWRERARETADRQPPQPKSRRTK